MAAEAATSFLLQNLRDGVVRLIKLNADARNELELLQKDLESMKKNLQTAAEKKSGPEFRDCEIEILEVVYDAEDLVDSFVTQEFMAQSSAFRLNPAKIDLVSKMKEFRKAKLEPAFRRANPRLAELSTANESSVRTKAAREVNPLVEKTVVGMEDEVERFVKDLLDNSSQVEAVCIVGMAGLGKTTIASKIYRDPRIDHHFPTRIWVNVSEDYKKRDIYLTIISNFTKDDMSGKGDSDLAHIAQKHLCQVKFMLVMDDVWTAQAWNEIKEALPIHQGSGKVLVTSRYDIVAARASPRKPIIQLRFLTQKESWRLLQVSVYEKEGVWPDDSKVIGQKICGKCGGLPLAIVVIGGILLDKIQPEDTREEEWKKVFDNAENLLLKGDLVTSVKDIIGLSYDKMPYYLRDCFLYMGACPKDFEISTWKLVRLWVSEGFIEKDNSSLTLEQLAEENLKELIRRNLVMVGRKNSRGDVKTCRVHDMIREFCKTQASNFLKVMSKLVQTGRFHPEISEISKFRRICVHSHVLDLLKEKVDGARVRSFISFSKHETAAEPTTLAAIVQAFKLLRVFEGSSIRFPKFLPNICQLIHLRYIALATGENFKALTSAVEKLWNLQTIVIETSQRTFEIRADISQMTQLRHLKTKAAIRFKKETRILGSARGAKNGNLQTLTRLSSDSCTMETLSKTPNLQKLGIYGDIASLGKVRCLDKLNYLKSLKMISSPSDTLIPKLLDETHFPPKLEILTLSATNLEWHYMSTLGHLKLLKVLKLKDYAFGGDGDGHGDEWKVNRGEFKCLKYLEIERSDLLSWTIEEGSLAELRVVCLHNCKRLLRVPEDLTRRLKTLEMGNVSTNAVLSAKKIEKEKSGDALNLILAPGTYVPGCD